MSHKKYNSKEYCNESDKSNSYEQMQMNNPCINCPMMGNCTSNNMYGGQIMPGNNMNMYGGKMMSDFSSEDSDDERDYGHPKQHHHYHHYYHPYFPPFFSPYLGHGQGYGLGSGHGQGHGHRDDD